MQWRRHGAAAIAMMTLTLATASPRPGPVRADERRADQPRAEQPGPDPAFVKDLKLQRHAFDGGILYISPQLAEHTQKVLARLNEQVKKTAQADARFAEAKKAAGDVVDRINELTAYKPDETQRRKQIAHYEKALAALPLRFEPGKTRIILIDGEASKAYMRGGGKIPQVTFNPLTDDASAHFQKPVLPDDGEARADDFLILPVRAGDDPAEVVDGAVATLFNPADLRVLSAVLFAAMESIDGIRLDDHDLNWFYNGVLRTVVAHVSDGLVDASVLQEMGATEKYAEIKNDLNLRFWHRNILSIVDLAKDAEPVEHVLQARRAYAQHEMQRLLNKHGEKAFRDIIQRLRAKGAAITADEVFDAVRAATGEDLAKRLKQYQSFDSVDEAIERYSTRYAAAKAAGNHEAALMALIYLSELRFNLSNFPHYHLAAADLLRQMGDRDAGKALFLNLIRVFKDQPGPLVTIKARFVDYALACDDPAMAYDVADAVLAVDPHYPGALKVKAHREKSEAGK